MATATLITETLEFNEVAIRRYALAYHRKTVPTFISPDIRRDMFQTSLEIARSHARRELAIAQMSEAEKSATVAELKSELALLSYKPAHVQTAAKRRELETQIAALAA